MVFARVFFFFFFNDTATTEIYTLSLHDALPISLRTCKVKVNVSPGPGWSGTIVWLATTNCGFRLPLSPRSRRSEEHTSELQSRLHLVCRLLLEKKKKQTRTIRIANMTQLYTVFT